MFRNFSSSLAPLDGDFVFVNKNAQSACLSRSQAEEKSWMDSHVRKRHARKKHLGRFDAKQSVYTSWHVSPQSAELGKHALPTRPTKPRNQSKKSVIAHGNSNHPGNMPHLDSEALESSCTNSDDPEGVLTMLSHIHTSLPQFPAFDNTGAHAFRSLAFFQHRTVVDASGWADEHFWKNIALPLGHANPAMLFALSSLGALHESLTSTEVVLKRAYRKKSLELCNRAIQTTVGQETELSSAVLLPLCVVFTTIQTFECIHAAFSNLRHSIKLVTAARSQSAAPLSSTERDVIDTVEELLERYQCRLTLIVGLGAVYRNHNFLPPHIAEVPTIPRVFASLHEARACLEQIQMWSYELARTSRATPDRLARRMQPHHDHWLQALDHLTDAHKAKDGPLQRTVNLLKVARIGSFIVISTMNSNEQTVYDNYIDLFRGMIDLYQACGTSPLGLSRHKYTFGFDAGTTETLSLVALACRDSNTRQCAIDILSSSCRVEGALTSSVAALVGRECRAIEEDGLLCNTVTPDMIPESRRVRVEGIDFFERDGLARLRYIRSPYIPGPDARYEERWFPLKDASRDDLRCTMPPESMQGCLNAESPPRSDLEQSGGKERGAEPALPWPEAFTMKSGRLFFPIPRV